MMAVDVGVFIIARWVHLNVIQFKSFPVQMGRLTWWVGEEMTKGNFGPAIALAAVGPGFAAGSLAIKDFAQSRGGDDNQSVALRKRNLLKSMGYDEKIHGNEDNFLGWYWESILHMGGFGLLANMVHDIAQASDNGAYGQMRIMGTVFGPTVSNVMAKSMNIVSGATNSPDNTNAKERQAVREIVGMVPLAGQNSYARESAVDFFAGEKQTKKKDTWGKNNNNQGGWGQSAWDKKN